MRVLIPLPDRDFDPTEVAVPWHYLTTAGHDVVFATETGGAAPQCDPKLLTGVLFGRLGAEREPIAMYRSMSAAPEYRTPSRWCDITATGLPHSPSATATTSLHGGRGTRSCSRRRS